MAAAASDLDNGVVAALQQIEEEEMDEPPEQKNNNASAVPASSPPVVPWMAAVAERYERREKLGEGMFGDVYKAYDRVLERFVAVKRLSGRTDDRFVAAALHDFAREVMSLAACRGHPSVVQLLGQYADRGRPDGDCFVVTEYAGPMNLSQYMRARRVNGEPFDEAEVRDAMEQLLAGARHAHMAGVLHRDIVPENVIVDLLDSSGGDDDGATTGNGKQMTYKICGFGVSEPAAQQADKDDSGLLASSSPYRAPELFLGSKDYDGRVDTWSLGCIMAELVTGGVPFFAGTTDEDVLEKMMHVAGAKGIVEWKGLERLAPSEKVASLREMACQDCGCLKEKLKEFKPQVLSPAGFKVLEGLLDTNPDSRLSAAAALSEPWFQPQPQPRPRPRRRRRCFFGAYCFMPHGAAS